MADGGRAPAGGMTPAEVAALFTGSDGRYHFARWGRPIVPVVFGVERETLGVIKGAIEAVVLVAGHRMAERDGEIGANLMIFFLRDWAELPQVPDLGALVPGLGALCARLAAEGANQYRVFRHDADGAIRAVFVFLRMDAALEAVPAEVLALLQAVQVICLWSADAFLGRPALGRDAQGRVILRPQIAAVIRAGYDPALPVAAGDASHAYRLAARMGR